MNHSVFRTPMVYNYSFSDLPFAYFGIQIQSMKRTTPILLAVILSSSNLIGQVSYNPSLNTGGFGAISAPEDPYTVKRVNAFYIELLGNAFTYAFCYDMRFRNSSDGPGGKIGIGAVIIADFFTWSLPVQVNWLLGKDGRYFEIGGGGTIWGGGINIGGLGDEEITRVTGTMTFGYRRQPPDGGFLFRIAMTPFLNVEPFVFFPFWGGISFGYAFPSK